MGSTGKPIDAALSGGVGNPSVVRRSSGVDQLIKLSELEVGCFALHADGHDFVFLSERYNVSEITVRLILNSVLKKLGAANISHATKIAIRMGLIEL